MGRSTRRQVARERARKRRQRQLITLGVIAVIAVVFVGALILLSQNSAGTELEVGDYNGIPQGVEEDGTPYIGEADAPVTLVEYGDFGCPHCADFASVSHQLIDTYVADGTLRYVFKPMGFVTQNSPVAAVASLCAVEQGMFWEMHDALFTLLRTQGSAAFTQGSLIDAGDQIGLERSEFASCVRSSETRNKAQEIQNAATQLGINATPTLVLNGQFLEGGALSYSSLEQAILASQ